MSVREGFLIFKLDSFPSFIFFFSSPSPVCEYRVEGCFFFFNFFLFFFLSISRLWTSCGSFFFSFLFFSSSAFPVCGRWMWGGFFLFFFPNIVFSSPSVCEYRVEGFFFPFLWFFSSYFLPFRLPFAITVWKSFFSFLLWFFPYIFFFLSLSRLWMLCESHFFPPFHSFPSFIFFSFSRSLFQSVPPVRSWPPWS